MELNITLELYKDQPDYERLIQTECKISIDKIESNSPSGEMLEAVYRHLYHELEERLKTINMQVETDR